jgi:hypothetical protein
MVRKIIGILLVCGVLLLLGWVFLSKHQSISNPVGQTSEKTISYCHSSDLEAILTLDHAAGNVYGTFTLKNISSKHCQVLGSKFIDAQYTSSNTKVIHEGQVQAQAFDLVPNQTIYSQVHYPNGPQCGSETVPLPVIFTYMISPTETIVFRNQTGQAEQLVQSCKLPNDITEIQLWNMSSKPISGS